MAAPIDVCVPYRTADEHQHLEVVLEAYDLFCIRSVTRGDMWRSFPPSDKIRELRERISRIESANNVIGVTSEHTKAAVTSIRADAIDIINYAAFLIKQIDEGAEL